MTATRACARHRGQCSIASQWTFGLIVNPHRGQLSSSEREEQDADVPGFITTASRIEVAPATGSFSHSRASKGAAAVKAMCGRHAAPTRSARAGRTRYSELDLGLGPTCDPPERLWLKSQRWALGPSRVLPT